MGDLTLHEVQTWIVDERVTRRRALRSDALYCDGKMFAFIRDGKVTLRLPVDVAQSLVSDGKGTHLMRGQVALKNWVVVEEEDMVKLRSLCLRAVEGTFPPT